MWQGTFWTDLGYYEGDHIIMIKSLSSEAGQNWGKISALNSISLEDLLFLPMLQFPQGRVMNNYNIFI